MMDWLLWPLYQWQAWRTIRRIRAHVHDLNTRGIITWDNDDFMEAQPHLQTAREFAQGLHAFASALHSLE